MQENLNEINKLFNSKSNITIISHVNPDGDAIGSSLALYWYLLKKNNNVSVVLPNEPPDFLLWLPGADNIIIEKFNRKKALNSINNSNIIICVDFNATDRIKPLYLDVLNSKATKILIDHHIEKDKICDIEYTNTEISSTSELIYEIIEKLKDDELVDTNIAQCLYVGIMTDTGSFSHNCNYENTFAFTAKLIARGANPEKIHNLVYNNYSEYRLRLLGLCLSDRLVVLPEFSTAYIWLSKEDLKKFNFKTGDTEGFVNYTMSMNSVVFGALITERTDIVKMSFRSKGSVDVNKIARDNFGGGGHINASGADLKCSLEEAIAKFENILPQYREMFERESKNI